MNRKKNITINDVARNAGVSISTVSRVLNDPSKVKKETCKKVNAAIHELKFSCNSLHFKNADKNNRCVIIFTPSIFTESLAEITLGASEELEKHNIGTLIWNSNESTRTEMKGYSFLKQDIAQGAIFITSCVEDFSLESIDVKLPIVAIERTVKDLNIDVVNVDAEHGINLLIDHLYQLGHRSIGFLCGDVSSSYTIAKTIAYKKALEQRGIQWDASSVISSGWTIQCGYKGAQNLLSWCPRTTAIICISDVLATGAVNAIHNMGYSCPGDISVTGFDNMPSSAYQWPPLTTLSFPGYEMGQIAAKKIIHRLEEPEALAEKIVLPLNLIQRNSTGFASNMHRITRKD